MLTRTVKRQLVGFVLVTAVALFITAANYIQLPHLLGFGRYTLTLELPQADGLFANSAVEYRGVEVGAVTNVSATATGATATLAINNGTHLPANSEVEVRSTSVIGEEFVDFVPPQGSPASTVSYLPHDAVVSAKQISQPTDTSQLLNSVNSLLSTLPIADLQTTIDQVSTAFGNDTSLGSLIDNASVLTRAATAALPATKTLIAAGDKVLRTQQALAPAVQRLTGAVADLTAQAAQSDAAVQSILSTGPAFFNSLNETAVTWQKTLPALVADVATVAQVSNVYMPGIEHLLIILPALIPEFTSIVPEGNIEKNEDWANLFFKLGLDPPPCTTGFQYANQMRDPSVLSPAPIPQDSWCKVPELDPRVMRGARNSPCPDSSLRSATAAGCGLEFGRVQASTSGKPR